MFGFIWKCDFMLSGSIVQDELGGQSGMREAECFINTLRFALHIGLINLHVFLSAVHLISLIVHDTDCKYRLTAHNYNRLNFSLALFLYFSA